MAKLRLNRSNPSHRHALDNGWKFAGFNSQTHRQYEWFDGDGKRHLIVVGNGMHSNSCPVLDLRNTRSRMRMCVRGSCRCHQHIRVGSN